MSDWMPWVEDDGGRALAGYKGKAGDCGVRSIAIATGLGYQRVYDELAELLQTLKRTARAGSKRSKYPTTPRNTLPTAVARIYMAEYGWEWQPTMGIGTGCTTHLAADELPAGRLVVALSKHWCAVVDGVVRDTYDPNARVPQIWRRPDGTELITSDGPRCVYGYHWKAGQ